MPRVSLEEAVRERNEASCFTIASSTDPKVTYTLQLEDNGLWSCSCPGYHYRGYCKHSDKQNAKDAEARGQSRQEEEHG